MPKTPAPYKIPTGRLLSVAEFAKAINRGLRTAYDMVEDGRVRTIPIGANRIGIPPEEVPRFLKNPTCKSYPRPRRVGSGAAENTVTT